MSQKVVNSERSDPDLKPRFARLAWQKLKRKVLEALYPDEGLQFKREVRLGEGVYIVPVPKHYRPYYIDDPVEIRHDYD